MMWDNDIYRQKFGFKTQHGLELASQLKPVPGKLLEIGSETGILSYELWKLGYTVEGIEFDYKLVDMARRTTAKSVFYEGDIDDVLLYENNYAMVIANDVLHRVPRNIQPEFLANVYQSMHDGAEMTFDMGAYGNNAAIEDSLAGAFASEGMEYQGPYYPTDEEYQELLVQTGFTVDRLVKIDRPQKIKGKEALGMYIEMFYRDVFKKKDDQLISRVINYVTKNLEGELYDGEDWILPQVRLLGKVTK